ADEEFGQVPAIGAEALMKHGVLDKFKGGPVIWLDSADFGPSIATGTILSWKITIDGKAFHSGYPQNAINPIELSSHLLRYLDQRFHTDFGKHPQDEEYKYKVGSSF